MEKVQFISYILYLCFVVPMLLSLFILQKRARLVIGYILVGATLCLFISELNGALYSLMGVGDLYFCITVSPLTEEIIKALPVLAYAFFISDNRSKLVEASFAVGLGFAIFENMIMVSQNVDTISVPWALIRGFGAGLMHSVCTVAVGIGIAFVRKKKKLFCCGTLALLMLAVTYHAIYNTIVMSPYKYFGFTLPLSTYIPILYFYLKKSKKNLEERL